MRNKKVKNIIMANVDHDIDANQNSNAYYDEQEREEVEKIQWEWDYLNKYELFSYPDIEDDDEEDDDEEDWDEEGLEEEKDDKYNEQERERKIQIIMQHENELLHDFRDAIIEYRKRAISMRAFEEYERILFEVNDTLGEDDWEDDFVPDEKHIEELKEARRIAALKQQLENLMTERQRYLDAIQESETLISKLKEKNVAPSIIADEQALIDKNKTCIEELDIQISALQDEQ